MSFQHPDVPRLRIGRASHKEKDKRHKHKELFYHPSLPGPQVNLLFDLYEVINYLGVRRWQERQGNSE